MQLPRLLQLPILALCATILAPSLQAQVGPPPTLTLPYEIDTGWARNQSTETRVIHSFVVQESSAYWLRLYFDDVDLGGDELAGTGAFVRITSHEDGEVQELGASSLYQWQNSSAYFNGRSVQVELVAPPGIGGRISLKEIDCGLAHLDEPSICGSSDDRVFSADPRVARLLPIGCTGWMIDDCDNCLLTAGHCSGGLGVAQFNVPRSRTSGAIKHPSIIHQYPIDPSSIQTNGGQGVGSDWAYFGTFGSNASGLRPFDLQQAAFTMVNPPTTGGNDIRITGHGTDSGRENQAQQTHVGPMVVSSGTVIGYVTDTTGGNSGSPVIWEQNDVAIGIHTHGGCGSGGGNNWGTGVNHSALQAAIANPQGVCECGGSNGPTVLFSDGFESDDFQSGGWNLSNNRPRTKLGAANSGLRGARIRRTSSIERSIDTSGFASVELFYSRRTRNLDAGEQLSIEWFDGSGWTLLESTAQTGWSDRHYVLPSAAAGNPSFKIRFSCNANEGKERGDVDDVLVIAN